jgi:hypothetical protein
MTDNDQQNTYKGRQITTYKTQKTKNWTTRIQLKTGNELRNIS